MEINLQSGDAVKVFGLNSRADLNDLMGTLLDWSPAKGRWSVRVGTGESVLIKPANLQLSRHIACSRLPAAKQTGFVRKYQEAVRLINVAADASKSFPTTWFYDGLTSSDEELDVSELVAQEGFLSACSAFIRAMSLTDARLHVVSGSGSSWSVGAFELPRPPDLVFHLTDDPPPEDRSSTQLTTVTPHSFVILLTSAWGAKFGGMPFLALRIANELDRHLEIFAAGAPNDAQLEPTPEAFGGLTVGELRSALACLGLKVSKQLYRLPPGERAVRKLDEKARNRWPNSGP